MAEAELGLRPYLPNLVATCVLVTYVAATLLFVDPRWGILKALAVPVGAALYFATSVALKRTLLVKDANCAGDDVYVKSKTKLLFSVIGNFACVTFVLLVFLILKLPFQEEAPLFGILYTITLAMPLGVFLFRSLGKRRTRM
jgi:uncharacterized protein (DUF486 family)